MFLIDHSWTYLPENCYQQLHSVPGLARRMADLMDLIEQPSTPSLVESDDESHDESHDETDRMRYVNRSESSEVNGIDESAEEDEDEEEENQREGGSPFSIG